MDLTKYIASVPDYPEKGVIFRDISPLMADGEVYRYATQQIVDYAKDKDVEMIMDGPGHELVGRGMNIRHRGGIPLQQHFKVQIILFTVFFQDIQALLAVLMDAAP